MLSAEETKAVTDDDPLWLVGAKWEDVLGQKQWLAAVRAEAAGPTVVRSPPVGQPTDHPRPGGSGPPACAPCRSCTGHARHRVADGCHREREATGGRLRGPNAGCWAVPAASAVAAVAAATAAGGTAAAAAAESAAAGDADSSPVTPGRSGRAPGEATLDRRLGRRRALEQTPSPAHEEFGPTICSVRSSNVLSLRATAARRLPLPSPLPSPW